MKTWKQLAHIKEFGGLVTVREHTDLECTRARARGGPDRNLAPRSHGFVNCYRDGAFVGWCGVHYAEKCLIYPIRPASVSTVGL
jgi:hypothetical protein